MVKRVLTMWILSVLIFAGIFTKSWSHIEDQESSGSGSGDFLFEVTLKMFVCGIL